MRSRRDSLAPVRLLGLSVSVYIFAGAGAAAGGATFGYAGPATLTDELTLLDGISRIYLHNLGAMLMLVLAQLGTFGTAGVASLVLNGYRGGQIVAGLPLAAAWVVPELVAASLVAGSGLTLALAIVRWLRTGDSPTRELRLAAGTALLAAVAVLAVSAGVETGIAIWCAL